MATVDDIMKQVVIVSRKIDVLNARIDKLEKHYGHVSAEVQRLRQIINKGAKS